MTKQKIKEALLENVCTVRFTKVDGTIRDMRCTLMDSLIPEPVATDEEINRNRKQNDSVQVAWDLDKNGWRSFRVESVIEIQTVLV